MKNDLMTKIETTAYNLNHLTREQAVELAGSKAVEQVEKLSCEYYSGELYQTWTANVNLGGATLTAVYYMSGSAFINQNGEPVEDLGNLDWQIDHYRIS